jgi:hypothetical protein
MTQTSGRHVTSAQPDYRGELLRRGQSRRAPVVLARTSQDGRGVLTVKAVALSALFVGVVVLTVIKRRRELDADSSWHPGDEGYPPHVRPGW